MSKKANKHKNHRKSSGAPRSSEPTRSAGAPAPQEHDSAAFSRLDYLAVLPGLLMCAMTLIVLILDFALPSMEREQYVDYPAMFRLINGSIIAAGILFWILLLRRDGFAWLHPKQMLRLDTIYVLFFALMVLWMLLSTLVNGLDDHALHGVPYRNLGIFHLCALFLFYMFLSARLEHTPLRTLLISSFLFVADLMVLAVLFDRYVRAIPAFAQKKEISAIFFNGNHYGYFMVFAVLLAAGLFLYHDDLRLRIFGLVTLGLNLWILGLNHSLGCLLAVAVGLLVLLIVTLIADHRHLQRLAILFAILVAATILGLILVPLLREEFMNLKLDLQQITSADDAGSAGHNRWMLWQMTCDLISQRPLFGYGCEGLSDYLMNETGRANPHNEFLNYASWFGIPAAIFYVLGLLSVFFSWIRRRIWCDAASASAALTAFGYVVSSLFGVPMFYTLPFFFIFLGMSLKKPHWQ